MTKEEFKEKWENYWYHHKFGTWVGIIVFVFLAFTAFEYFTKKEPDMIITYLGTYGDSQKIAEEIENSFSNVIDDINNDGEKCVSADKIITNPQNFQGDLAFWQSVNINISTGESYLYFVDERIYEMLKVKEVTDLINTKDGAVEFVDVTESKYFKKCRGEDHKLYLVVRKDYGANITKKAKLMENNSKKVLEKILENN